jgi:uncharacterized protein
MYLSADAYARLGASIESFVSTFSGLAFETLPFLLFGVLLSAAIQSFVPERAFRRLFPSNRALSILASLLAGLCLPICECASVPLARRLRQSGLPLSSTVAFLLAAPIVNPLTIVSTYVAFKGTVYESAVLLRLGIGLSAAALIAIGVELGLRRGLISESAFEPPLSSLVGSSSFPATTPLPPSGFGDARRSFPEKGLGALDHASYDFLDMARYLIAGIAAAALVRSILPGGLNLWPGARHMLSAGLGIGSAYVLSLCSSADAFVARSAFSGTPYATILAFLAMGPMMDLKNTLLLSRFMGLRRAIALAIAVAIAVGAMVALASFVGLL